MAPDQTVDAADELPDGVSKYTDEDSMEASPFIQLTTPGAKMRILLTMLRVEGEKLNPSAICERSAIHHDTWYEHRDDLLRFGVIEEAEPAGNSPMYRVDMDDPLVTRFDEIRHLAEKRAYEAREELTEN